MHKFHRNLRSRKGFTLIELMIVVVIIGILAALAIPRFGQASARAKEKEAETILKQYYTLQQVATSQNGAPATTLAGLQAVGYEMPTNVVNYTVTEALMFTATPFPRCLAPVGTPHRPVQIANDGAFTYPASC